MTIPDFELTNKIYYFFTFKEPLSVTFRLLICNKETVKGAKIVDHRFNWVQTRRERGADLAILPVLTMRIMFLEIGMDPLFIY